MSESAVRGGGWLRWAAILSLILFVAGPLSANQGFVTPLAGFAAFAVGGILGVVTSLVGIVKSFRRGLRAGREGVVFGGFPAAVFVYLIATIGNHPRINDISTDLEDPPSFVQAASFPANRDRDMAYPESFVPIVRETHPDLGPLFVDDPPAALFDRALLVARGTPSWRITSIEREKLVFEGVSTSRIFRFRDDFVVRVRRADGGSQIDMRSKSRDGQSDLGANARRIRIFLGKLHATS